MWKSERKFFTWFQKVPRTLGVGVLFFLTSFILFNPSEAGDEPFDGLSDMVASTFKEISYPASTFAQA